MQQQPAATRQRFGGRTTRSRPHDAALVRPPIHHINNHYAMTTAHSTMPAAASISHHQDSFHHTEQTSRRASLFREPPSFQNDSAQLHQNADIDPALLPPAATEQSLEVSPIFIDYEAQKKRKRAKRTLGAFPCPSCSKTFERLCDLNKHQKHQHTARADRPYACSLCDKRFIWPKDLRRHGKQVHDGAKSTELPPECGAHSLQQPATLSMRTRPEVWTDPDLLSSIGGTHAPMTAASGLDTESSETFGSPGRSATISHHNLESGSRTFSYEPLERGAPEQIRLLTVMPAEKQDDPLICTLTHHDPSSAEYEALSYTWGYSAKPEHAIDVNGHVFPVRENLHSALRNFRQRDSPRILWVDAICINQGDSQERSAQVGLMHSIFQQATRSLIWLGDHDHDSRAALSLAGSLDSSRAFDGPSETVANPQKWHALGKLMNRPYFSRLWVVQEIALAREALLQCGDTSMAWSDFEDAVSLAAVITAKDSEPHQTPWNGTLSIRDSGASRLIQVKSSICRFDDTGRVSHLMYTLQDLIVMSSSWPLSCSDPRDRLYAILSLAKDAKEVQTGEKALIPVQSIYGVCDWSTAFGYDFTATQSDCGSQNEQGGRKALVRRSDSHSRSIGQLRRFMELPHYQHPLGDFYARFFEIACTRPICGNMDMLCRPWAVADRLPSWMPTLDRAPLVLAGDPPQLRRKTHDPLVGTYFHAQPYYSASGALPAQYGSEWEVELTTRNLRVTGFVLDTVASTCDASQFGNVPDEWLQFADQPSEVDHTLWRILVADRGPSGTNPPAYYKHAFKRALERSISGLEISQSIGKGPAILDEFLARVESVVWDRRLYRSDRHRRLGLGPKSMCKGDLICIVAGVSVPLILRPSGSEYVLIGDSYLHGVMDGEAMKLRQSLELPITQFCLV